MVNHNLFIFLNDFVGKSPFLDNLMVFFAKYLIFLVPLVLVYIFLKNRRNALFVFLSVTLSYFLSNLIGLLFYSPRPFAIGLGTQLVQHVADSGFPSDHTTIIFAFSFALLFLNYKKIGIIFLTVGMLVGIARIFTGVHFPFDIFGGVVVGFVGSSLLYILLKNILFFLRKRVARFNSFTLVNLVQIT